MLSTCRLVQGIHLYETTAPHAPLMCIRALNHRCTPSLHTRSDPFDPLIDFDFDQDLELAVYDSWFDPMISKSPHLVPDGFIYLKADPGICMERWVESCVRKGWEHTRAPLTSLHTHTCLPYLTSQLTSNSPPLPTHTHAPLTSLHTHIHPSPALPYLTSTHLKLPSPAPCLQSCPSLPL
jgi:hypothetical protein